MRLLLFGVLLGGCCPAPEAPPVAPVTSASATLSPSAVPSSSVALRPPLPPCLPDAIRALGPFEKWGIGFDGQPAPDRQPPPPLGSPSSLPLLPRSTLAFVRSGRVFSLDLPEGVERAVSSGPKDSRPALSAGGKYLAFLRGEGASSHVLVARADGSNPRELKALARAPLSFSKDERWLTFAGAERGVIVYDLSTGTEREVATKEAVSLGPLFEPDRARLVYADAGSLFSLEPGGKPVAHGSLEFKELQSLAVLSGAVLLAGSPGGGEPHRQTTVRRLPLQGGPSRLEFVPERTAGAWVELAASPGGTALITMVNSRPLIETNSPGQEPSFSMGSWVRRDVVLRKLTPGASSVDLGGRLPQPYFQMDSPVWAPDARHLVLAATLQDAKESDAQAHGILVVDTEQPQGAIAYLACGEEPAWGGRAAP